MQNLSLKLYPDPILESVCQPCNKSIPEIKEIGQEMIRIMYEYNGLGLSAPQVGLDERIFVMRDIEKPGEGLIFANPVITNRSGTLVENEGCLSLPGIRIKIARAIKVDIQFDSLQEEELLLDWHFEGYHARCVQHEVDHLNGIMILDHIKSKIGKRIALDKYYKRRKSYDRING